MSKQEQFDYLFKIVMIGDSGVGKTNLLSRFVDGSFTTDSKPTIGVEFATKTLIIDNKSVKNQIWDTAGQQRFRAITNAYYRGAVGAIIVFDLTKARTFENVQKWYSQLKENAQPDITVMLLGNKSDLEAREAKIQTIQNYINQNHLLYMETSAATGKNVDEGFNYLIKEIYEKMKMIPDITPTTTTTPSNNIVKDNTVVKPSPTKEDPLKLKDDKKKNQQKKKDCC